MKVQRKEEQFFHADANDEEIDVMLKYTCNKILETIKKYKGKYPAFANQVWEFYTDYEKVKQYYALTWAVLPDATVKQWVKIMYRICNHPGIFVEELEKFMERAHCIIRVEERIKRNPIATTEELRAGVYKEELEAQVRDAVFTLRAKGYDTVQSGFTLARFQTMTIYGESVAVPSSVRKQLQKFNLRVYCKRRSGNLHIELLPTIVNPITLNTWTKAWNCLAEGMPKHKSTASREYQLPIHSFFKQKQYDMQEGKNVFLGYGFYYVNGKAVKMSHEQFESLNGRAANIKSKKAS